MTAATATAPVTAYVIHSISYEAESATILGTVYTISVTDDGWHCTCKAGEYTKTRGRCWHLRAAQAGDLGKPRVRMMPLPARAPTATIDDLYSASPAA